MYHRQQSVYADLFPVRGCWSLRHVLGLPIFLVPVDVYSDTKIFVLRCCGAQTCTDVLGQLIGPVFKGRVVQEEQRAKPSQPKVLTEGGDLRKAQVDVPLSGSHSCV